MKKIITIMTVSLLILALFAGCSDSVQNVANAISDAKQASSASEPSVASSSVPASSSTQPASSSSAPVSTSSSSVPASSSSQPAPSSSLPESSSQPEQNSGSQASGDADKDIAKSFVDIMLGSKFTMKFKAESHVAGQIATMDATQYVSGDKVAMLAKQNGRDARMLLRDGKAYMIDDAAKVMFMIPDPGQAAEMTFKTQKFEFNGTGIEDFMGKSLPYGEYEREDGVVRIYVDGANLAGMKTIDDVGDIVMMEILEFSDTVDESVFEIPTGYQTMG